MSLFRPLIIGLISIGTIMPAFAESPSKLARDQEIHDYIKKHPEVIYEALEAYQTQQEAKEIEIGKKALKEKKAQVFSDSRDYIAGNKDGDETLVEFFDYSCGYCKKIQPDLDTLLKDDSHLKIIYKEFPILGPGSLLAAKAALASKLQGKYGAMHAALMEHKGAFDMGAIGSIAHDNDVDFDKLKADMETPEIVQQIGDTLDLARSLKVHGTPALIIGGDIMPGVMSLGELKEKLAQSRTNQAPK